MRVRVIPSLLLVFCFFTVYRQTLAFDGFDERHVQDAACYANHSYFVAQELLSSGTNALGIEKRMHIKGQEVYPFVGQTGDCPPFSPFTHAVGAVYRRENENRIYVAYHGTYFLPDWVTDVLTAPVAAAERHQFDGLIHMGFSQVLASAYDSMVRQICAALGQTEPSHCEFIFCGHSLGGAVATIAATRFSATLGRFVDREDNPQGPLLQQLDRKNIKLVSISSPLVGDVAFARSFSTFVPCALRFYHRGDIVAKVPPTEVFGFKHVGREIEFIFGETTLAKLSTIQGAYDLFLDLKTVLPAGFTMITGQVALAAAAQAAGVVGKLMHLVPDEYVILRAYNFEKQYRDDPEYLGISQWDPRRNGLVRAVLRWFV